MGEHHYGVTVEWTGNLGTGTSAYRDYSRDLRISADGKPSLTASGDPAFLGDPSRYNPEELLIAALSGCHMLWYLHLCSTEGVNVVAYADEAEGVMRTHAEGGEFVEVVLRPHVSVPEEAMATAALELHERAHRSCFIASSVAFPVRHEPRVSVVAADSLDEHGRASGA